jgi:hypothetical protein
MMEGRKDEGRGVSLFIYSLTNNQTNCNQLTAGRKEGTHGLGWIMLCSAGKATLPPLDM